MRFGPASVLVLAAIPLVASGSTRNLKGKDGDKAKHHHRHKMGKKEKKPPADDPNGPPIGEAEQAACLLQARRAARGRKHFRVLPPRLP